MTPIERRRDKQGYLKCDDSALSTVAATAATWTTVIDLTTSVRMTIKHDAHNHVHSGGT